MTDINSQFLDPNNVIRLERAIFGDARNVPDIRSVMYEFIAGPVASGAYDIWSGTDARIYAKQLNDEFIAWFRRRVANRRHAPPSTRVEVARILDRTGAYGFCQRDDSDPIMIPPGMMQRSRGGGYEAQKLEDRSESDIVGARRYITRDRDDGIVRGPNDPIQQYATAISLEDGVIEGMRARGNIDMDDPGVPYHLALLDAQLAAVNPEGIHPRPRVNAFLPVAGTNLDVRSSIRGRVSIADERKLTQEGMSSDSMGCISHSINSFIESM